VTRLAQLRERIQALSDKFVGALASQKIRRDLDALKENPFDVIVEVQDYYEAFDDPGGAEKHAAESDWNINNELRLIFTGFQNHDAQASTDHIVRTSGSEIEAVKAAYHSYVVAEYNERAANHDAMTGDGKRDCDIRHHAYREAMLEGGKRPFRNLEEVESAMEALAAEYSKSLDDLFAMELGRVDHNKELAKLRNYYQQEDEFLKATFQALEEEEEELQAAAEARIAREEAARGAAQGRGKPRGGSKDGPPGGRLPVSDPDEGHYAGHEEVEPEPAPAAPPAAAPPAAAPPPPGVIPADHVERVIRAATDSHLAMRAKLEARLERSLMKLQREREEREAEREAWRQEKAHEAEEKAQIMSKWEQLAAQQRGFEEKEKRYREQQERLREYQDRELFERPVREWAEQVKGKQHESLEAENERMKREMAALKRHLQTISEGSLRDSAAHARNSAAHAEEQAMRGFFREVPYFSRESPVMVRLHEPKAKPAAKPPLPPLSHEALREMQEPAPRYPAARPPPPPAAAVEPAARPPPPPAAAVEPAPAPKRPVRRAAAPPPPPPPPPARRSKRKRGEGKGGVIHVDLHAYRAQQLALARAKAREYLRKEKIASDPYHYNKVKESALRHHRKVGSGLDDPEMPEPTEAPSPDDYKQAAQAAYLPKPPQSIKDFQLVTSTPTVKAWQRGTSVLVAFRGTKPTDRQDLYADSQIPLNRLETTPRFMHDMATVQQLRAQYPSPEYSFYGTGHSLGGAILDELATYGWFKGARTYNSAIQRKHFDQPSLAVRRYNENDPLYRVMGQYAQNTEVSTSDVPLGLEAHGLEHIHETPATARPAQAPAAAATVAERVQRFADSRGLGGVYRGALQHLGPGFSWMRGGAKHPVRYTDRLDVEYTAHSGRDQYERDYTLNSDASKVIAKVCWEVSPGLEKTRHANVHWLGIDVKGLQQSGLGRQIWDDLLETLLEQGVRHVTLDALESAEGYWTKMGFMPTGEHVNWEEEGRTLQPMHQRLSHRDPEREGELSSEEEEGGGKLKGGNRNSGFIQRMMAEVKMKHEGDADPYHYPSHPLVAHSTMNRPVAYDFERQEEDGHGEISNHIRAHFGPDADHHHHWHESDDEDDEEEDHGHPPRREMPHRRAREPEARAHYAEVRPRGLHGRGKLLDLEALQGGDRDLSGGLLKRVSMPAPEYLSEHQHLLHVLRHPTAQSLRAEATKQEQEVLSKL